jgi:hypothetical protein
VSELGKSGGEKCQKREEEVNGEERPKMDIRKGEFGKEMRAKRGG